MNVLVAYQSKHGATADIAERIAARLRGAGHDVDVRAVASIVDAGGYDAFVVGSAVYFGVWMKEAVGFARRNVRTLSARPVWLFSSGPLGDLPPSDPKDIADLSRATHARGHRVFYGALDPRALSMAEKLVVGAIKAPEGDFREWDEIDAWADAVARQIAQPEAVTA